MSLNRSVFHERLRKLRNHLLFCSYVLKSGFSVELPKCLFLKWKLEKVGFISVLSCSLWDTRKMFCSRNLYGCDNHFEMMLMTLEISAIKLWVIVRTWRLSVFVFYLFISATLACTPVVREWNVIVKIIKNVESYVNLRTHPPRQDFQIPESYYAYNFAGLAVSVLYEWYYKGYCKHN